MSRTPVSPAALSPAAPAPAPRVALVIDRMYHDLGGTENQVMKVLRGLDPRLSVELVVLEPSEWLDRLLPHTTLKVTVLDLRGGPRRLRFWRGLRQLVRHLRGVDVVHTFFPIANIVGAVAARLAGVRAVVGSRRDYGYWITPAYLFFTRQANRLVTRIVSNSHEVKRFTAQTEGFPADRIEVIYNGVDLSHLQLAAPDLALRRELGIPDGQRVVTLVANYRPIKRQDTLVEALALLARERSDVCVLFVGEGNDPFYEVVDALVEQHGLRGRVFNAHAKGDIERYLSFVDIGCNCSESEGLSNAVMEYMAAGVPCVVSDGGGNKDLIEHERNGLVFPVGDAALLARHIARLLDDTALRQRCIDASLHRMATEMALPVIIDRFERFYTELARA